MDLGVYRDTSFNLCPVPKQAFFSPLSAMESRRGSTATDRRGPDPSICCAEHLSAMQHGTRPRPLRGMSNAQAQIGDWRTDSGAQIFLSVGQRRHACLAHKEAGYVCTNFETIGFGDLTHSQAGLNEHSLQPFDPAAMDFLDRGSAERLAKPILQCAPGKSHECRYVAHLDRAIAMLANKSDRLHHGAVLDSENVG